MFSTNPAGARGFSAKSYVMLVCDPNCTHLSGSPSPLRNFTFNETFVRLRSDLCPLINNNENILMRSIRMAGGVPRPIFLREILARRLIILKNTPVNIEWGNRSILRYGSLRFVIFWKLTRLRYLNLNSPGISSRICWRVLFRRILKLMPLYRKWQHFSLL